MAYEHRSQPLLRWPKFLRRLARSLVLGASLILGSLLVGMAGYHYYEGLGWLDSYINAAMILSGMGPLFNPVTNAGKVFAGTYALYSGIAVLAIAGVVFAPVVHRFLHALHADQTDDPPVS